MKRAIHSNNQRYVHKLLLMLLCCGFLSIIAAIPTHAAAQQSTISITTSANTLSFDLLPKQSASFGKSAASTISVSTDNFTGYTLSIATVDPGSNVSSTTLSDASGHTISSIGSSISESTFESDSSYNNKWGYRPSQYVSSGSVVANTNFLPAPSTTGDTIDITSAANSTANTYTVDFATKVDYGTPAGSYSRNLVVAAVANNIVYNITYDKGMTSDTVANMPSPNPQIATMAGGTPTGQSVVQLSSSIPTRTGYTFSGWCDIVTPPSPTTGDSSCMGNLYQAGGDYGIDQTTDGSNIRLYAMWTSNKYSLSVTFADNGVSSVQVRTRASTQGQLVGTISTSGGSVSNLAYNMEYYLYPVLNSGYILDSWTKTSATGTLSSISSSNPTFTMGLGNGAVTIATQNECIGAICYLPNGNDVEGDMSSIGSTTIPQAGKQSASSYSDVTLVAPNYKRDGYGFAGWSPDANPTNASTIYGPNETITTGDLSTSGLKLYAVWVASTDTLQDWTGCDQLTRASYSGGQLSASLDSITALEDERDGNVYAVARLADGYCWMIENLRYENQSSSDADLSEGFDSSFIALTPTSDDWSTMSTVMPQLNTNNTNIGGQNTSGVNLVASYTSNDDKSQWYSYGDYYSWSAAIANTNNYGSDYDPATSICPSNWTLPYGKVATGGNVPSTGYIGPAFQFDIDRSFSDLDLKMGGIGESAGSSSDTTLSKRWRQFPNNFLYSGSYIEDSADQRGTAGLYWSKTSANSSEAYLLSLDDSTMEPGTTYSEKYNGYAIRCIFDNTRYLQNVDSWRSSLSAGQSTQAVDRRDGQVYRVSAYYRSSSDRRIRLWMSNLNIGAESMKVHQLDDTNSNISSGTAVSATTFMNWDRQISGTSGSDTAPKFTVLKAYNSSNGQSEDSYGNKYGALYNLPAASAGTFQGAPGDDFSNSICPSGWRVPTGGTASGQSSAGEMDAMISAVRDMNPSASLEADLGYALAGSFTSGSPTGQGSEGNYWSSTTRSRSMYVLYLTSSNYNPTYTLGAATGLSIRCVSN